MLHERNDSNSSEPPTSPTFPESRPPYDEATPLIQSSAKSITEIENTLLPILTQFYRETVPGNTPKSFCEKFNDLTRTQKTLFCFLFFFKLLSCLYQFVVIGETVKLAADARFINEADAENLQLIADLIALFFLLLDFIVTAVNNSEGLIAVTSKFNFPTTCEEFYKILTDFFTLEGETLREKAHTFVFRLTVIASTIGAGYKANVGSFVVGKRFLPDMKLSSNAVTIISNIFGGLTGIASYASFLPFQGRLANQNRAVLKNLNQMKEWEAYSDKYFWWFCWVNAQAFLISLVSAALQGMSVFFATGSFEFSGWSAAAFAFLSIPSAVLNFIWLSNLTYIFGTVIRSILKNSDNATHTEAQENTSGRSYWLEMVGGAFNSFGTAFGFFAVIMRTMLIASNHEKLSQESMLATISGSLTSLVLIVMLALRDYMLKIGRHHNKDRLQKFKFADPRSDEPTIQRASGIVISTHS